MICFLCCTIKRYPHCVVVLAWKNRLPIPIPFSFWELCREVQVVDESCAEVFDEVSNLKTVGPLTRRQQRQCPLATMSVKVMPATMQFTDIDDMTSALPVKASPL